MRGTTDFVNAKTGELLRSIPIFLDTLGSTYDIRQAISNAGCAVGFESLQNVYKYPILVISTIYYDNGTNLQIKTTVESLLQRKRLD